MATRADRWSTGKEIYADEFCKGAYTDYSVYWKRLEQDMLQTGAFEPSRIRYHKLRSLSFPRCGRAVLWPSMPNGAPAWFIYAFVARLKTRDPSWQEIGLSYVVEWLRNRGMMSFMLHELITRAPPSVRFFGITDHPAMMSAFARHELVPVTKHNLPNVEEFAKEIGLGARLPDSALRDKKPNPKAGERWLFAQIHRME